MTETESVELRWKVVLNSETGKT